MSEDWEAEMDEFIKWARHYYGPRAGEYLAHSGVHFLTPQTAAMFAAWLAAKEHAAA